MRANHGWGTSASAAGLGALLFTYGCGGVERGAVRMAAGDQAGVPVVVTCEPDQRTIVRPTVVNGTATSQVECVTVGQSAAVASQAAPVAFDGFAPVPVSYRTAPRVVQSPVLDDTRVIPASAPLVRPVRTRQVVVDDDDRPVRVTRTRSVKKSAIIIGSSAGAGAGVGAAIGGKKGALIGAAIGGGGAALWDQITRRK